MHIRKKMVLNMPLNLQRNAAQSTRLLVSQLLVDIYVHRDSQTSVIRLLNVKLEQQ